MRKIPQNFALRHDENSCMSRGFECGEGWFDLIDTLCASIQSYIDQENEAGNPVKQVVARQVKEKLYTLRFYYNAKEVNDPFIDGMIYFAERISEKIPQE
ncbi:hypothetical protein [Suttonella ornithocola]|uniref:hypothetical protein n=1 Tax=Suttonella ornithocola TaxID=279832 RepID=UPI000E1B6986|nr:hypothetical protein [Suttonella ornithocola]